jgi:hypothetical protein
VNGLTNVALPAIRQGNGYKGYLEADCTIGVGNYRSNFLTLATSQGYKFTDWFYMGAGIGVDLLWSTVNTGWGNDWATSNPDWAAHEKTSSAVMIPVFTDFRFNIGSPKGISFFADVRLGASFLVTNSDLRINEGYITNNEYFYLRPSIGIHIPVNPEKNTSAFNIGISYQLLTANYWDSWQRNTTLNALGVNASYEW